MKVEIECQAYVDQERRVPRAAMVPDAHRVALSGVGPI
jgi:hypothetical protein